MSSRDNLSHESVELQIYIDNERHLYDQKFTIQKNLATKFARGVYSHALAPKAFASLVERGAKGFAKEHSSSERDWNRIFSKKDRDDLAGYFVHEFEVENKLGNFDHVLPKKYQPTSAKPKSILGRRKAGGGGANMVGSMPYYASGGGGRTSQHVTHLLTDWRYVACRKGEQKGTINASRSPGEVTCPRCQKATPHYDWAKIRDVQAQLGGRPWR